MKKFIIVVAAVTLTVSAYAMSKTPANATATDTPKVCTVEEACPAVAEAKAACPMTEAKKAVEEKSGCTGGVCPLKK